ncbi:MAG: amino acid adenylation domain-containing protein [Xenococcus sp. MO_188.B8]|nr:amino acid adenylation domain-containing protein [Xenococcus sp. MO_188.B8]
MKDVNLRIAELSPAKRAILEQKLKQKAVNAEGQENIGIKKRRRQYSAPLSSAQTRMWLLDQLEPGNLAYNRPSNLKLTGRLNINVLEKSLNEIVRRHEILRTSFRESDGQIFQEIASNLALTLSIIELSHLSSEDSKNEVRRLTTEEAQRPFDLSRLPLIRATLLRLGEEEHILLLTMHHIIFDGWSMGVLLGELATVYEAFCTGKPSPLPELPIQYADFAHWQQQRLQGNLLASELEYWKKQLAGDLPVLELPTDRPRTAVQTNKGARQGLLLPKNLSESLKDLSRTEGVTLFMTLLAAFGILLHRYTGQEDIIVGSPIGGRDRIETENLIGFFINTLVLRTQLDGNPTFKELLARVKEVATGAIAHQEIPLEKLVEELQPERDLIHTPLFQVLFQLRNIPQAALELQSLKFQEFQLDRGIAAFDLTLDIVEEPAGLSCVFAYKTDLFDAATITQMAGHFQTLLSAIVENPQQRVGELPLLTPAEKHQLLVEWNDTKSEYPSDKCIHQLFEEQVEKTPDAVAVVFEDKQLTYRELNARANQLARYLRSLGVKPEVLVGICLERSLEMVVGLLAILKAGGAYVPIAPALPTERIAYMLENSQARVLLTQQDLFEWLPKLKTQVVYLDSQKETIAQENSQNLTSGLTASNLVYVTYTSGSTGAPKGVQIEHRSMVNFLSSISFKLGITPNDTLLSVTTISFDISVLEIFGPLTVGARLVLVSREVASDGTQLLKALKESTATVMQGTPVTWRLLLAAGWVHSERLKILCGGETWSPELANQLLERGSGLWNLYGPTETTIWSSTFKVESIEGSISIGRPIANTEFYILDAHHQPVPIGVPGELFIGGDGLARGYLNRPELTQEKFIPNPFDKSKVKSQKRRNPASAKDARERPPRQSKLLYKTGDLARYLPDGNIECLGRIDSQVKIRGFRIELGEIESVLSSHPQIQQAVVIAREDVPRDKRLVAYIVSSDKSITSSQLRQFLKQKLPEYMVPSAFILLENLPLTPNGKVDRRALPIPEVELIREGEYVAPHTATEEIIANLFAGVLKIENVGIHDNFFELGGHSLLATQLVSRLRKTLSVKLPLRSLFEAPTVGQLAEQINTATRGNIAPIRPVSRDKNLPLSFAQQRLWFLDQLEGKSPAYNMPMALRLMGKLNVAALEQALAEIIQRHETLRTKFSIINGSPVQVINFTGKFTLPIVEVKHSEEVERLVNQERSQPFDLVKELLIRVKLLRLNSSEHLLLITLHHIISDGWSMGILSRELTALYSAFCQGNPSPLSELPIQYADFAAWQQEKFTTKVLETQLAYWRKQLLGALPGLELTTDKPRPAVQTFTGKRESLLLRENLSKSLVTLSQQEGVTLFMTLLAAFKILLSRWSGSEDIVVGSPVAGRNRPEIEPLIGFFINTLVLRTNLGDNPSFRSLLGRVKEVALGAIEYQDMPFEKLVEELQPERSLSHTPLFQVWFNMINLENNPLELPGLKVERLSKSDAASKFDLTLYVRKTDSCIKLDLVYNADLFTSERMVEMLHQLEHLLGQIVEHPTKRIDQFSLVTPKIAKYLPNPQDPLIAKKQETIPARFIHQVKARPQHLAIVDSQNKLNYDTLDKLSNKLANYLILQGIQPQDTVAIYGHRSAPLVVALIGILKAGAAFMILDPAYPASRLVDCMEMAKPKGWICLEAAGEISSALEAHLKSGSLKFRLTLSPTFSTDQDHSLIGHVSQAPKVEIADDSLAYIAFTSGTTGTPKGILGTHAPLSHFLQWHTHTFNLQSSDRFSLLGGLAHDPLLRDIFTPLWLGATLYIPTQEEIETPGQLKFWMAQYQITIAHLTPAMGQLLRMPSPTESNSQLNSLRYAFFGGDVLTQQDVAGLKEIAPQATSVNFYGTTETPQVMGYYVVPKIAQPEINASEPKTSSAPDSFTSLEGKPPIGVGIEGAQLLVVKNLQQLASISEVGEIYVRTPYLAKGYLSAPNKARFIQNPFSKVPGDRLYRTGDLGRYRPDGQVEYLGRIDSQIKLRGFRIELGDVETTISQHPAVQAATVVLLEKSDHDKCLVAYYVLRQDRNPIDSGDLRRFLNQQLPSYMVPSFFVALDELPLTPNGKIDRQSLPNLQSIRVQNNDDFAVPQNELERQLIDIWERVLTLKTVKVNDNFFDLGGHSLMAVQLFTEIEKIFGKKLPLATLFQATTVKALANIIRQKNWLAPWSSLVPIQPNGSKPPLFYMHAGGGNLLFYRDLALSLGSDQPVYGLQPRGLDGNITPSSNILEMAEFYISQIRTIQPEGPYYLAGLSTGGLIAWEIARQLEKQGQSVGLLALFDTYGPGYPKLLPLTTRLGSVITWVGIDVIRRVMRLPGNILSEIRNRGLRAAGFKVLEKFKLVKQFKNSDSRLQETRFNHQINKKIDKYKNVVMHPSKAEKTINLIITALLRKSSRPYYASAFTNGLFQSRKMLLPEEIQTVRAANFEARTIYRPQPFSGRAILFRASERPPGIIRDPNLGWQGLAAGGMKIYEISGTHTSIVKSPMLATILKRCLDEVKSDFSI